MHHLPTKLAHLPKAKHQEVAQLSGICAHWRSNILVGTWRIGRLRRSCTRPWALSTKVNVMVNRMQVYADGMEFGLRAEIGLASQDDDLVRPTRTPGDPRRPAQAGTALHLILSKFVVRIILGCSTRSRYLDCSGRNAFWRWCGTVDVLGSA
jgi:hypothetical protein